MGSPAVLHEEHLEGEVRVPLVNNLKFAFLTSSGQEDVGMMAADEPEDPDVNQDQVSVRCAHTLSPLTTSQDVRLVPEENGAPPVVLQVRVFLALPVWTGLHPPIGFSPSAHAHPCRSGSSRSSFCRIQGIRTLLQSHLPPDDLERIVGYVSELGHDVCPISSAL